MYNKKEKRINQEKESDWNGVEQSMVRLMTRKKKKTMEDERGRRVELEDRTIYSSNLNTPFEFDTQKWEEKAKAKHCKYIWCYERGEGWDEMRWDEYKIKTLWASQLKSLNAVT